MDVRPKRRILSLSLSQPGKQHKKSSKLKRNASTVSSDIDNELVAPDLDQQYVTRRGAQSKDDLLSPEFQPLKEPVNISSFNSSFESDMKSKSFKSSKEEKKDAFSDCGSSNRTLAGGADSSGSSSFQGRIPSPHNVDSLKQVNFKTLVALDQENSPISKKNIAVPTEDFGLSGGEQTRTIRTPTGESFTLSSAVVTKTLCFPEDRGGNLVSPKKMATNSNYKASDHLKLASSEKVSQSKTTAQFEEGKCSRTATPVACCSSDKVSNVASDSVHEKPMAMKEPDEQSVEILQCPLCNKTFDKLASKTTHLKGCASKHKISTQQLIEALELQQRQALERKALGLPKIFPSVGLPKKTSAPKKEKTGVSKMDSGLQLAMALSLSLHDQEQAVKESLVKSGPKALSLDHFGFRSQSGLEAVQPHPPSTSSRAKGKVCGKKVPTLLTRTNEERQQIITEKVAMVLLEEVESVKGSSPNEAHLHSRYLQDYQDKENYLWERSCISPSEDTRDRYYVKSLSKFISPCKGEVGSKMLHLSQVVGRSKTPPKVPQPEVIDVPSVSPSDEDHSSESCTHEHSQSTNLSHIEMELRAKLFNDWAAMVNNSSMSDIAVYPKEGREIPAHKIILHVRCARILLDVSKQRNLLTGNEVEVIMWSNTPHSAALAFLEYVYCGSVKSIRSLSSDLSCIISLANQYKIADLQRYLRAVGSNSCQLSSQSAINAVLKLNESPSHGEKMSANEELKGNDRSAVECQMSVLEERSRSPTACAGMSVSTSLSLYKTPLKSGSESIYSEATFRGEENFSACSSPDMFSDEINVEQVGVRFSKGSDSAASPMPFAHFGSALSPNQKLSEKNTCADDVELVGRPPSVCASISSDKTVLLDKPISAPSSTSSNECASELLDINDSLARETNLSQSELKRKYSVSSDEDSADTHKRLCSVSPTKSLPQEAGASDVELLDLTQDSNSGSHFPELSRNVSVGSSEKDACILESDLSDTELNTCKVIPNTTIGEPADFGQSLEGGSLTVFSTSNDILQGKVSTNQDSTIHNVAEPYVSPVWDGFEELNYDDVYFSQPMNKSTSPPQKTAPSLRPKETRLEVPEGEPPPETQLKNQDNLALESKGSGSSKSNLDDLLDDSFTFNESVLRQAESAVPRKLTQRETKGTPVNRVLSSDQTNNVTPIADYSIMDSPELKRELKKFGLKPSLGKRKGKIMLRHIYNELHPWVPAESDDTINGRISASQPSCSSTLGKKNLSSSQPTNPRKLAFCAISKNGSDSESEDSDTMQSKHMAADSCSQDSSSSGDSSLHEGQFLEDDDLDSETSSQVQSQAVNGASLPSVVHNFIVNDKVLHQKVLEYEPLWIEQLQTDLRSLGHKFKLADLMAFLDEKCITFRTAQKGSRVKKKKCRSSKKRGTKVSDELSD